MAGGEDLGGLLQLAAIDARQMRKTFGDLLPIERRAPGLEFRDAGVIAGHVSIDRACAAEAFQVNVVDPDKRSLVEDLRGSAFRRKSRDCVRGGRRQRQRKPVKVRHAFEPNARSPPGL